MGTVAALKPTNGAPAWWQDNKMVALVKRTAAKDCNTDEFDEFVAVAKELNLNPLRKQIYAFVFNKEEPKKRNMVIVVGIDGMRSISARTGLYRPDSKAPRWTYDPKAEDPDRNPLGLVSCEVSIFIGHKLKDADGGETIEWNEVPGIAYWDEFAPIVKIGDEDDYELVETGETWPDSGKPKKRRKLRAGAQVRLQLAPGKDGWRKSGRHMLAKCAEAIAHRKANPEPLARVYADEEIDRARTIEGTEFGYTDLSPSEMAAKGEADHRLERIGGPAILVFSDKTGAVERVLAGQFADWVLAEIKDMTPAQVATFRDRNKQAVNEFWAHNKTDALELKKVLEARCGSAGAASANGQVSDAAPPTGRRAQGHTVEANKKQLEDQLLGEIAALESVLGCLQWAQASGGRKAMLGADAQARIDTAFSKKQDDLKRDERALRA
jgi:phage recombination protein Bet